MLVDLLFYSCCFVISQNFGLINERLNDFYSAVLNHKKAIEYANNNNFKSMAILNLVLLEMKI